MKNHVWVIESNYHDNKGKIFWWPLVGSVNRTKKLAKSDLAWLNTSKAKQGKLRIKKYVSE